MPTPTIRSVLAATDLGEGSDAVVRRAATLAAATGSTLHILHAFESRSAPEEGEPVRPSPGFPGRIAVAEQALEEQIRRAVSEGTVFGSRTVVVFAAGSAILARAVDVSADVIVLGPHRPRRGDRVLGTTADRVVRAARVPVLIAAEGQSPRVRNVLVPVDLSQPAHPSLELAIRWTAAAGPAAGARLHVLYVVPRLHDIGDVLLTDEHWIAGELRRVVEEACQSAGDTPAPPLIHGMRSGDQPAEEILRYADEADADLLILATHGRGAVARIVLGSVASAVTQGARCPVLLLPPALWRGEQTPLQAPAGAAVSPDRLPAPSAV